MSPLSWAGYWFYAADNATERAALFASYGLLEEAHEVETPTIVKRMIDWFWERF